MNLQMRTGLIIGAFFLLMLLAPPETHSAPGDLYVSQPSEGTILKFSPDSARSTFASGLDFAGGLAFDRSGNLFVTAGLQPGSVLKFTPSGEMSVFVTDLSVPGGLAFDGAGNLYVTFTTGDTGGIWKLNPDGIKSSFGSFDDLLEIGNPIGLAFSPAGNLFGTLAAGPFNFDGGVFWFAPDETGHTFSLSHGPGLAFDRDGSLYVTNGDEILKYPPLSPPNVFASGFTGLTALAFDLAGNLFVAEGLSGGTGSIKKIGPDGTKSTFASGLTQPTFLAFEPVTEKLRNISARGLVGIGNDVLIGGFIVGGSALPNNAVIVRAIGPSLTQAGISNPLADPTLELHNASGAVIASNDDWQDTQEGLITAAGLAPTDPNESAIYATLPAGNYTAVVRGAGDTTGTALVEVYSLE